MELEYSYLQLRSRMPWKVVIPRLKLIQVGQVATVLAPLLGHIDIQQASEKGLSQSCTACQYVGSMPYV